MIFKNKKECKEQNSWVIHIGYLRKGKESSEEVFEGIDKDKIKECMEICISLMSTALAYH